MFLQVARLDGRDLVKLWPLPCKPRYLRPAEVRPRISRCLCVGLQIQLMRGSSRNALVHRVNHDDFVVLVHGILVQPVRVQHSQRTASSRRAFLGDRLQVAREFELGDAAVHRLPVHLTLVHRTLTTTATDAGAVDDKTLLGLVSETTRLVRARRARHAADGRKLAILPHAGTRCKKRITSDCFFFQSSSTYL